MVLRCLIWRNLLARPRSYAHYQRQRTAAVQHAACSICCRSHSFAHGRRLACLPVNGERRHSCVVMLDRSRLGAEVADIEDLDQGVLATAQQVPATCQLEKFAVRREGTHDGSPCSGSVHRPSGVYESAPRPSV